MEHATLHALQLVGLLLALGGPLLVLGLLRPACRTVGPGIAQARFAAALEQNVARWVRYGALAAALAALGDCFIQSAELEGKTLFNGVSLALVARFATHTIVGQLGLARAGTLLLAALTMRGTKPWRWWPVLWLSASAVVWASLVSHAAAQPTARLAAIAIQALHLCAGTVWLGVLLHLVAARRLLQSEAGCKALALIAEMVRRFSPCATAAVTLLFCSGLLAVYRLVGEPAALLSSAYGLTLLLKLMLLMLVLYAGYRNYGTIRPALLRLAQESCGNSIAPAIPGPRGRARCPQRAPKARAPRGATATGPRRAEDSAPCPVAVCGMPLPEPPAERKTVRTAARRGWLRAFGRALELEVTAGLLVVTVAGILGSVSPPGRAGIQRLTEVQARALLQPHWPRTSVANPQTFYGAPNRTLSDLRYAEFTHNWSGVAVVMLGLCWLAQSVGGRPGQWAARLWPGLLVLFGLFIAAASDPEVWLLRRVSLWQAAGDPQLLEHQLGAVLVFVLASTAWYYHRRPQGDRLLGYALPGVMVFGSLLLLGHAHSTLNATQDVSNLVNVQHAVFGTFGLLAGMFRWLSLRGLIRTRWAAWIWPSLVIGLGLFMAVVYRETTC